MNPSKLNPGFDVCGRSFGHYPWDDWERWALSRGLDADLAGQARLLIREAYNHGWESWLQSLCGWGDDGQALLAFALRSPKKARWCFCRLMETDGLRGDVHPKTKEWTWGYLRLDTRRVLSTLHNATVAVRKDQRSTLPPSLRCGATSNHERNHAPHS